MKTLRCANPKCQREIQYGAPIYVLPFRDPVYCSAYCFARHMCLYELRKDDPETDEYDLWWEEENKVITTQKGAKSRIGYGSDGQVCKIKQVKITLDEEDSDV